MKKILIGLLFCFTIGFANERNNDFNELKGEIVRLKYEVQLQQRAIEEQNKLMEKQWELIEAYEGTEKGLDSKIIANASLNYNVDQFYNTAWNKLENHLDRGLNVFMWIIGLAFAGIGLIIPYIQNQSFRETKDKIKAQESSMLDMKKNLDSTIEKLGIQEDISLADTKSKITDLITEINQNITREITVDQEKDFKKKLLSLLEKLIKLCDDDYSEIIKELKEKPEREKPLKDIMRMLKGDKNGF